jgi:hypothetical protein
VPTVQIVLAVEPPLFGDALCGLFDRRPHCRVAYRTADELSAAVALRALLAENDAAEHLVVAICALSGAASDSRCARLALEFPEVVIYGVENDQVKSFRSCIEIREFSDSLDGLLEDLRRLAREK